MSDILWQPSTKNAMQSFMFWLSTKIDQNFLNWQDLYDYSLKDSSQFWQFFAEYSGINFRSVSGPIYVPGKDGSMFKSQWFPQYSLNYAENLLVEVSKKQQIISICEGQEPIYISGEQLRDKVCALAGALNRWGLKPKDHVGAVLPNNYEAIVAMLAVSACGAVWSSCSPDFGAIAISERFKQVKPKVVFSTTSYFYNGKKFDCSANIKNCLEQLPSCKLHLRFVAKHEKEAYGTVDNFIKKYFQDWTLENFYSGDFNHHLFIMFSSGTTGTPKCIVHGAGGTLIQHLKEHLLHVGLTPQDKLLFYTTCGWMMWNWMVSALATKATVVTYDGAPGRDNMKSLWSDVCEHKVTVLGTSPKFINACMQYGICPKDIFDLSALRIILSTGSPLLPEHYRWVYSNVSNSVQVSSISGGTDILSCFMLGNSMLPVRCGEIQSPGLGMAISAYDVNQQPVINQKGELVCTQSFPSMPVKFLHDPKDLLYKQSYFKNYGKNCIWYHGDYVSFTDSGGIIVYGRSDATLNPGGVRIGTSELYRQVETLEEVADSLAVGIEHHSDVRVVIFVQLSQGFVFSDQLASKIKSIIRQRLTPRHVPHLVLPVKEVPYTRNGKKVELVVKSILLGKQVTNSSSLVNPNCLNEYYQFRSVIEVTP